MPATGQSPKAKPCRAERSAPAAAAWPRQCRTASAQNRNRTGAAARSASTAEGSPKVERGARVAGRGRGRVRGRGPRPRRSSPPMRFAPFAQHPRPPDEIVEHRLRLLRIERIRGEAPLVRGVADEPHVHLVADGRHAQLDRDEPEVLCRARARGEAADRKSTRLNSSHGSISYAVFCLKKKKKK